MHRSSFAHALLFAAGLLAAGPAHAQSTVTATYSLQILLADLDPSDGVDPGVTLDPLSRSTVSASASGTSASWQQQGDSAFAPVSTGGQVDGTGGSASFAGDPFGAGATLVASAVGGPALDVGSAVAVIDAAPFGYTMFTVAANTEVTFAGGATVDWNASNPAAATYGEVDMGVSRQVGDGLDLLWMGYVVGGYYGDGFGPLSGLTGGLLGFTFDNDTDAPVVLGFQVFLSANASELETVLSPVDEPADGVLLLAGAATLLGGLGRRGRGAGSVRALASRGCRVPPAGRRSP